MATEIEHKYLVRTEVLPRKLPQGKHIRQGFLATEPVVRIRLVTDGRKREAFITIKGKGFKTRAEYEYPIPRKDAQELLKLCGQRIIEKIRRKLGPVELDEFIGRHRGLWLAEIELKSPR